MELITSSKLHTLLLMFKVSFSMRIILTCNPPQISWLHLSNPGIWLIFPAYNVIVAILLTQNYHPNACNPWLHYNNARKLFCLFLALLYYFYSEKASRTYLFYKSSRRQLVFLLFFSPFSYIMNHSSNYCRN